MEDKPKWAPSVCEECKFVGHFDGCDVYICSYRRERQLILARWKEKGKDLRENYFCLDSFPLENPCESDPSHGAMKKALALMIQKEE